jgi:hypothetical protein
MLQCRYVKALCELFKEYPASLQQIPDANALIGLITAALHRFRADAELQEAGNQALAALAAGHSASLVDHLSLFVDALSDHPQHCGVQESACLVLAGMLREPRGAGSLAAQAAERGAVKLLIEAAQKHLEAQHVVTAAISALAALLEKHPRSCSNAAQLDAVGVFHSAMTKYPRDVRLQISACHGLAHMFWRQPSTAAQASDLKAEEVLARVLTEHGNSAEALAEASSATAWMVAGHRECAEAVALAGLTESMMSGVQRHIRIRSVLCAVCHALSQLFDENNSLFSNSVRVGALSLILELLRREPGSTGIQRHASLALANLCARHSGSAADAAAAGAFELLLASHRHHSEDDIVQGNALLAMARIIESHPPSAARAGIASVTSRFAEALKQGLLDDFATVHVAAALAQLYTFVIRDESPCLPAFENVLQLLQRHPTSSSGAACAGMAEVLPTVLPSCAEEPALLVTASSILGILFSREPPTAASAEAAGVIEILLEALRRHPLDRKVQAQVTNCLAVLIQMLPSSASTIYEAGGDKLIAEALLLHPEAEDVRISVNTASRLLGKFVPALTPFPFVPAELDQAEESF